MPYYKIKAAVQGAPGVANSIANVGDALFIGTGTVAAINYWVSEIVNPVLTGVMILSTIIWTYYSIKSLRVQIRRDAMDEGDA